MYRSSLDAFIRGHERKDDWESCTDEANYNLIASCTVSNNQNNQNKGDDDDDDDDEDEYSHVGYWLIYKKFLNSPCVKCFYDVVSNGDST